MRVQICERRENSCFSLVRRRNSLASDLRLEINTDSEIEHPENTKANAKRDFRVCIHNALLPEIPRRNDFAIIFAQTGWGFGGTFPRFSTVLPFCNLFIPRIPFINHHVENLRCKDDQNGPLLSIFSRRILWLIGRSIIFATFHPALTAISMNASKPRKLSAAWLALFNKRP